MDNPRKMIQRFANGIWSIEFHMTMIRTWALCVAKHYDEHAESWFTTQSKPSSERILAVRRVLDDLARDVSAHIVAPPNQTGAQWVLGVLELADGACTFAIHTDNFFVSCDCDSASDEDPFPASSRIITEESVKAVCQRHDYERIQRGLKEASEYASRAAALAQPGGGEQKENGGKGRKPRVNARMLETIQQNMDAMGWNCRQWAEHLKCVKSSVVDTPAWKDLKMGRERMKAQRALDRRRRPKGSDRKRD